MKLYKVTPEDSTNGEFLGADSGYTPQALDGKGIDAIQGLVAEREQIMEDHRILMEALAAAAAEQEAAE